MSGCTRLVPLGLAFVLLTVGTGCVAAPTATRGVDVVVGLYPYQYLAERVVGRYGTVTNLTRPGAEPHDLELTPQQVGEVSVADLAIEEKGLQPSFDQAIDNESPAHVLDVTSVVPLRDTAARYISTAADLPATSADGGPSLAGDPHIWQDPVRMVRVVTAIRNAVDTIDPRHRAYFNRRAHRLVDQLRALNARFAAGLAHCRRRLIVTSHAAFGYLAERYHLTMVAVAGLSPDQEPSAQWSAKLQGLIARDGVTTVFSETLGTSKYADALARDLGLKAGVLSTIEGLSSSSDHSTYFSLMARNLAVLRSALGCT
jgi:zinc transport system substrate-binding protein